MAFAAAYRRVGVVVLQGDNLIHHSMSTKAAKECSYTQQFARDLIAKYEPDVVVTEDIENAKSKGQHTKQVTSVLADTAENSSALDVKVSRRRDFANKYDEAASLAKRYPNLLPLCPKPRCLFDREPRATVIFEAVALAEVVRRNPTTHLAAAMG